jgi:transposase
LKRPENLTDKYDERQGLKQALELNAPLVTAYYMKEDLRQIRMQPDKECAANLIDNWIELAKTSAIASLVKMGSALQKYRFGILNWYDHPISSAPREDTNNKIKTLKRQPYGFRDLEFFNLKIVAIHQTKYALVG